MRKWGPFCLDPLNLRKTGQVFKSLCNPRGGRTLRPTGGKIPHQGVILFEKRVRHEPKRQSAGKKRVGGSLEPGTRAEKWEGIHPRIGVAENRFNLHSLDTVGNETKHAGGNPNCEKRERPHQGRGGRTEPVRQQEGEERHIRGI